MKTILFGSNNKNKLAEIKDILNCFNILSPEDFDILEYPSEYGESFEENAIIKARFYGERSGIECLADDSGLSIDVLEGLPGIHSARFAGNAMDNINRVHDMLKNIPVHERTAHFICVIAYFNPENNTVFTAKGSVDGLIIDELRGENGFGYDPIFYYEPLKKTFAEIESEVKNKLSHRYNAIIKMKDFLNRL